MIRPGRELDALVAEKVMGLKREVRIEGTTTMITIYTDSPCFNDRISPMHVHMHYVQPRHYSTSIADAWVILEKLCRTEEWDEHPINISKGKPVFGDEDCQPPMELYKHYAFCDGWTCYLRDYDIIAYGETAPHAICLAALKSVGFNVD